MLRELTSHKVNGCNEDLVIEVIDEPGSGGANHDYAISFLDERYGYNRSPISERHGRNCIIAFQNGPIKEAGVNGITHEALLAIIEDRLVGFQSGPYACADNAEALDHIRGAMECLQRRTKARVARGVEGTHAV
jgi:hypothetical protein